MSLAQLPAPQNSAHSSVSSAFPFPYAGAPPGNKRQDNDATQLNFERTRTDLPLHELSHAESGAGGVRTVAILYVRTPEDVPAENKSCSVRRGFLGHFSKQAAGLDQKDSAYLQRFASGRVVFDGPR